MYIRCVREDFQGGGGGSELDIHEKTTHFNKKNTGEFRNIFTFCVGLRLKQLLAYMPVCRGKGLK